MALSHGIPLSDGSALATLGAAIPFTVQAGDVGLTVGGRLPGEELRTAAIDATVSEVSAHPELRETLVCRQRELADGGCVVMVGRDIGTVVLPGAAVKLWITASPEERARRRALEYPEEAAASSSGSTLTSIRARDNRDTSRAASPLRQASDATIIETDTLAPQGALHLALMAVERVLAREHTPS